MTSFAKITILTCLLGAWLPLWGQSPRLSLELDAGGGAGWWYYLHQQDSLGGERMDRSHFEACLSAAVRLRMQGKHFSLALAYQRRMLHDDELVAFDERVGNRHRIQIAPRGESIYRHCVGLNAGYRLVHLPQYSLSAELEIGSFSLRSIHPDQANFGAKLYRQYHITQAFRLSQRASLIVQMQFSRSYVWMIEPAFPGEKHQIVSGGLNVGLDWELTKPPTE